MKLNIFSSLLVIGSIFLFSTCKKKECEVQCPKYHWVFPVDCECKCSSIRADAGNLFCVEIGSYVALVPKENDLDTFALVFREYLDGSGNYGANLILRNHGVASGVGVGYTKTDQGHHVVIDYMPPPDRCWEFYNQPPNEYNTWYRLYFEGYLPQGQMSDTLYATIHYLEIVDNSDRPVRDSISFTMFKAR